MFILDVLIFMALFGVVAVVIVVAVAAWLSMPLADAINLLLRRIGLAGPGKGSRSIGGRGIGRVDEAFCISSDGLRAEGKLSVRGELWNARCAPSMAPTLECGDEVEFVYDEDLTVTVIGKARPDLER
jgi:membrane-bound ClpP family serine protease